MTALLDVTITVEYPNGSVVLQDAAIQIYPGEIHGVLGRSGSGKSTMASAILGLLDKAKVSGRIIYDGRNLLGLAERQFRFIRGKQIALVLQAASSALHPYLSLEAQLREVWRAHSSERWSTQRPKVLDLLASLDLETSDEFLSRYPDQISVGQAQRLLIAAALMHSPRVLLMDEPTSALDCIARSELLTVAHRLAKRDGLGILFISHDLTAVTEVCDTVSILDKGVIVESGPVQEVLSAPSHPLTQAFAASLKPGPLAKRAIEYSATAS